MNATFDPIPDAGQFLQSSHGRQVCDILLDRIGADRG